MADWNQISSIVTAIGTTGLAIFAYWSFKGVRDQMNLLNKQAEAMKRQADAMETQSSYIKNQSDAMVKQATSVREQSDFVRDQSSTMHNQASTMLEQAAAMKKQADAMMRQADIMRLNLRKDRLFKEIDNLIRPLYEEFQPKKNATSAHYPEEAYRIRANFMANKYLGSEALRDAIDQFYNTVDNGGNVPSARESLFLVIKERYKEVQEELDDIDKELNQEPHPKGWGMLRAARPVLRNTEIIGPLLPGSL